MRKNCYLGSVDLAEAFYSTPVREQDKKYFRFMHNGQKFQFTALIMGQCNRFLLCSVTMTVRLPPERRQEIIKLCSNILLRRRITIRNFSKLIGKLVATQQGVEYAPLFFKPLEKIKEYELRKHHSKYNSFMTVPKYVEPTIEWWIHNFDSSYKLISHGKPKLVIYSDASKKGWGAFNETENFGQGGNGQ